MIFEVFLLYSVTYAHIFLYIISIHNFYTKNMLQILKQKYIFVVVNNVRDKNTIVYGLKII